jgi:hypothetical protein
MDDLLNFLSIVNELPNKTRIQINKSVLKLSDNVLNIELCNDQKPVKEEETKKNTIEAIKNLNSIRKSTLVNPFAERYVKSVLDESQKIIGVLVEDYGITQKDISDSKVETIRIKKRKIDK